MEDNRYEISTDSLSWNGAYDEMDDVHNETTREYLSRFNWPTGLQDTLIHTVKDIPIRYFIIDNSGSMIINDAQKVVTQPNQRKSFVKCSRWEEIIQLTVFHAGLANASGAVTEFRLLNNVDPVVIGARKDSGLSYKNFLNFLKRSRTSESTPLCRHIEGPMHA